MKNQEQSFISKVFSGNMLWMTMLGFVLFDAGSFLTFLYPNILPVVTGAICLAFLIITGRSLAQGALLILAELVAGVYGYGFFITIADTVVSLRLGMFIIWFVWFGYYVVRDTHMRHQCLVTAKKYWFLLLPLGGMCIGIFSGLVNANAFADIFFDANAWLWWMYAIPFISVLRFSGDRIGTVVLAGSLWWSVKALLLLYVFGHGFDEFSWWIYHWMRDYRLAELTPITPLVYRIFSQSMIYTIVPLVFMVLILATKRYAQYYFQAAMYGSLLMSGLIASYSRSFWLGTVVGFCVLGVYGLYAYQKYRTDLSFWHALRALVFCLIVGVGLWWWSAKIPLPPVDASQTIESRFTVDEPAATARLRQLRPLVDAIRIHPILGSGFGTPVTYYTTDPRIVSQTPGQTGMYTTTAFEWGYLDMMLDIGLFGICMVIGACWFIFKQLYATWRTHTETLVFFGFVIAFLMLLVINITTPYINHPLGIGYCILLLIIAYQSHEQRSITA